MLEQLAGNPEAKASQKLILQKAAKFTKKENVEIQLRPAFEMNAASEVTVAVLADYQASFCAISSFGFRRRADRGRLVLPA